MKRTIFSVSLLNETVRQTLEQEIGDIWVEGEISNLARPASGHLYFSLKDAGAQVRCAMFRGRNRRLAFRPENGLQIVAHGRVSLYPARGDYQLIVESAEPAGDGQLRLKFEQLKTKLAAEGLFDDAHKQGLPQWPRAIGIVTSASGAAVRDVINVLKRRCPATNIIVYPCSVQGAGAAAEIVEAIRCANRRSEVDVLLVARGGGSLEDLWSFNEEAVARAIFESALPIVSGIGHETDFSIADMVADVRAPTPSAAAELVSPDIEGLTRLIGQHQRRLENGMRRNLAEYSLQITGLQRRIVSPTRMIENWSQRCDEMAARLSSAIRVLMRLRTTQHKALVARLTSQAPMNQIINLDRHLDLLRRQLQSNIRFRLRRETERLERSISLINTLGPSATLERGYAIVTTENGDVVRDATDVEQGQLTLTRLKHGQLISRVQTVQLPRDDNSDNTE